MSIPGELSAVSKNAQDLVEEILAIQNNQELVDLLDPQELKLLYKCQKKSFELMQMLIDLKSKIQLRRKLDKKPKKKIN